MYCKQGTANDDIEGIIKAFLGNEVKWLTELASGAGAETSDLVMRVKLRTQIRYASRKSPPQ
ncbi:MAG TPA: hypothetical protein VH796_13595 [Nitrososphaeraceae archaeon]